MYGAPRRRGQTAGTAIRPDRETVMLARRNLLIVTTKEVAG